jgi:two-component system cell cycle response regulator DivK
MAALSRTPLILLVQPAHDDREMYAEYLRLNHLNVVCSEDAASAATVAEGADVIVTELRLPGTDGVELMRRLRDGPATKYLPIIVLTASVWSSERDRAEAAGCDVFLPKPCVPEALLAEVRRAVALQRIPKPRPVSAAPREQRHRRAE